MITTQQTEIVLTRAPVSHACGKIRYATKKAALAAKKSLAEFDRRHGLSYVINIFWCTACDRWHLGRRKSIGLSRRRNGRHL